MQLTIILAILVGLVSTQVPIPSRPDGYGVASWGTVLQVIQAYGTRIHFRIHTFSLPYHTNAFVASQGLHVIANVTNRNLDAIYLYTTKVFENQTM
ncbi:unnamed protein product [Rotaria sp. Silwood1]|nr:unnamed protein product [Rotaria sp. Silwood1]CAF0971520.1 unnamed protein product [Rotaria sp. Silwood1]CAF0980748.1 unnamed protein product [Rotaria sp. Silwood1]CAF3415260.1 unnamed protein product [Rotaria sp. Silwood1]CAF3415664.1 unnamed protein product [Rotaria sp. Silwood1]